MRKVTVLLAILVFSCAAQAQTPTTLSTETPTIAPTVSEPSIFMTIVGIDGTPEGQMTRFDYTATAGDVHIANLLTLQLFSLWAGFVFVVVVLVVLLRNRS